jgi:fido (protein-threonine AMPylation protein)
MASPNFVIRLPVADREALNMVAKIYGAKSSGGFVVEMIHAFCSGDPRSAHEFNRRLMQKAGEQLQLQFVQKMESELNEVKAAVKGHAAPRRAKLGQKGGRRAKRTK